MTTTQQPETIHIDPAKVIIGENVRTDARLDKEFIASIRERGVLVPVVGYRNETGEFVLLYGQRRTLAAVEAKRETIPAHIVAGQDEADRLIDQLAENDHRKALTNGERVQAFEQMSVIGLSAAQIAKRTATKRREVDAALTVAGSELATKAADRWDFLTLEQAATLAEFEDDAAAVKALTVAAQRGQFDHTAQRLRDARAEAAELAEAAAALTAQGITVVDRPAYDDKVTLTVDRLSDSEGNRITDEEHAECPGHAAYVTAGWEWVEGEDEDSDEQVRTATAVYVCTDYKAHGHGDRWATSEGSKPKSADMTDEQREQAKAERRDVIDSNKAWASAETVRREWLKQFLTRKTAPKGAAAFIATTMFTHADLMTHQSLNDTLGVTIGVERDGWQKQDAGKTIGKATEGRALVLALGYALAAHEHATGKHSWRNVNASTARYLAFLAANNYMLSEVEHRAAGTKPKK